MIHTLELSREISKDTFEQIISIYNMRWDKSSFTTTMFENQGIPMVRLRKEKGNYSDGHGRRYSKTHYMIYLSINPGQMNDNDPHLSTPTLIYAPSFIEAIYRKIIDTIPCLDECPEVRMALDKERALLQGRDIHYEKMIRLADTWFEKNAFKAHRIDYCFDLKYFPHEYLALLNQGYGLRQRNCMRMNVYNKAKELQDRNLPHNPNENYDFLRIEVQANKEKLYNTLFKWEEEQLTGYSESQTRELQFLITPEIEEYILKVYIEEIAGTGIYVSYGLAMEVIEDSSYSEQVKEKMKAIVKAVNERHGIAKVLELARKNQLPELGKESTVKTYLGYIHGLGINPVTISERADIPTVTFENHTTHAASYKGKALYSLLDIVDGYISELKEQHQGDFHLTEADFEAIDKLGPQGE